MPSGIANNPFLYQPRWAAIQEPNISPATKYLLEERDRELEDYLGSQTSGGGQATALRRTTSESHDTSTGYDIDFNVTDYENGAHASGGKIVIDTPGIWHCTTSWQVNFEEFGGSPNVQLAAGSQSIAFPGATGTDSFGNYTGFVNISGDFELAAGDIVRSGPYWTGGEVGGTITVSGCYTVLRLSAELVG